MTRIIPTYDTDTASVPALFVKGVVNGMTNYLHAFPPADMVTANVPGPYEPSRTVFNRNATNTRNSAFGIAKASAGMNQVVIALAGDSTTSQYNSGSMSRDFLSDLLAAAGVPIAGEIVMANKGGINVHTDERITLTGSWVVLGQSPYLESDASGNRLTFTSVRSGTSAQIKYMANGAARWRIDGGTWMTLAAVGTAPTFAQVDNLANTPHTIDFESTTASPTWIGHVGVFKSTGVIVVNTAAEGLSTGDWTASSPWNHAPVTSQLNPVALFMNLGINDEHNNIAAADFKTNLNATLNMYPSTTDIFIETSNPTTYSNYAAYNAAKYQLAATRNCVLVDMGQRFGTYATANAAGLYPSGETTHMNLGGYFIKSQARLAALPVY